MRIQYFLLILSIEAVFYYKAMFSDLLPFIELEVGTPGQLQKFLLDTGSFRMLVPCVKYKGQEKSTPPYRIEDSTTAKEISCMNNISPTKCESCNANKQCIFQQSFADKLSIDAYYFFDRVQFRDPALVINNLDNIAVGCVTNIENNLGLGDIAMIGLMPQDESYFPNLIDLLTTAQNRSFSICFNPVDSYISIGNENSGNSIPYYAGSSITFYFIKVLGLRAKQYVFNRTYLGSTYCAIDSGANGIVFGNEQLYNEFQTHFHEHVNKTLEVVKDFEGKQCVKYTSEDLDQFYTMFPTYTFKLENNIDYKWLPKNYLYSSYKGYYCLGLKYLPGQQGIILGTPWMLGSEFTFDQTNKRISFKQDCSWEIIQSQILLDNSNSKPVEIIDEEIKEDDNKQVNETEKLSLYEVYQGIGVIFLTCTLIAILIMIYYRIRRMKLYLYIKNIDWIGNSNQ